MEEHSKKLLTEIYQNVRMATQSIEMLLKKLDANKMTAELSEENASYNLFEKEATMLAKSYDFALKDNSIMAKAGLWASINMNTMANTCEQHIAQMMLTGSLMGIINLVKALTNFDKADADIVELAVRLEKFERQNIERLFEFLKVKPSSECLEQEEKCEIADKNEQSKEE